MWCEAKNLLHAAAVADGWLCHEKEEECRHEQI
jgi:hypothetical protein